MEAKTLSGFPSIQDNRALIIESYADIFSSFDSRGYAEKVLSNDFIQECHRILMDKTLEDVGISLKIFLPQAQRNERSEEIIIKRLHGFFHSQALQQQKKWRKDKQIGWLFVILGLSLSVGLTYLHHEIEDINFLLKLFTIIAEPASWFLMWTGGDKLMLYFSRERHSYVFYQRMSRAKIQFFGY